MTASLLMIGQVSGVARFLLMVPLCLSVALVYKVTRIENVREAISAALVLWVTILTGMIGLGVGLWLLFRIMA